MSYISQGIEQEAYPNEYICLRSNGKLSKGEILQTYPVN